MLRLRSIFRFSATLAVSAASLLWLGSPNAAEAPSYDLVLKGGHVMDPANNLDAVLDVAVAAGKIAVVEKDVPPGQAKKFVDVKGLFVVPGLIDIHYHIAHGGAPLDWFTPQARVHLQPLGIPADFALVSGTTTIVDAGTAGADTFLLEKEEVIDRAQVRVPAFLNIVANGMDGGLEQSVDQMDTKRCAETIAKYRNFIVGVKTAHYWVQGPWDGEHTPWAAVDRAVACAEAAKLPV